MSEIKTLRTLKLDSNNTVDTVLEISTLNLLFDGLLPKSVCMQTTEKEVVEQNETSDSIKVVLSDGTEEVMNYAEYTYFRHEDKELMVLESENSTLSIFHTPNSEEVFGSYLEKYASL